MATTKRKQRGKAKAARKPAPTMPEREAVDRGEKKRKAGAAPVARPADPGRSSGGPGSAGRRGAAGGETRASAPTGPTSRSPAGKSGTAIRRRATKEPDPKTKSTKATKAKPAKPTKPTKAKPAKPTRSTKPTETRPRERPPAGGSAGGRRAVVTKRRARATKVSQKTPTTRKPVVGPRRKRRLSKNPEAVRSRRRRAEAKGIREQLLAQRTERARAARERRKEQRAGLKPDPRRQAIGWLQQIRNIVAGVFPCSMEITDPEAGARTPWLVVGRYDARGPMGYTDLARALMLVRDDGLDGDDPFSIPLEMQIGRQRLSQIRVVYKDPRATRGEGDSIVSKIGAWEFVISDLVAELVGTGTDDEDALAVRYAETVVPTFYVYFSSDTVSYRSSQAWQRVKFF